MSSYLLLVDWAMALSMFCLGFGFGFGIMLFRFLVRTGHIREVKPPVIIEKP